MADTAIELRNVQSSQGAGAASFLTTTWTPPSDALVLVTVFSTISGGAPVAPTLTGNGLTYVQITSVAGPTGDRRVSLFRAQGSAPTSGQITISFSGVTQTEASWSIDSVGGADVSGTNGSGAIIQSATNTATATTSITVTLAAFAKSTNRPFLAVFRESNTVFNLNSGYVASMTQGGTSTAPAIRWANGYNPTTADTSPGASISTSGNWAAIAVELSAATIGSAGSTATAIPFVGLL